jgi:hypothetical protein
MPHIQIYAGILECSMWRRCWCRRGIWRQYLGRRIDGTGHLAGGGNTLADGSTIRRHEHQLAERTDRSSGRPTRRPLPSANPHPFPLAHRAHLPPAPLRPRRCPCARVVRPHVGRPASQLRLQGTRLRSAPPVAVRRASAYVYTITPSIVVSVREERGVGRATLSRRSFHALRTTQSHGIAALPVGTVWP